MYITCTDYDLDKLDTFSPNSLTILNANIRSLRRNFSHLESIVYSTSKPIDIICLTETFIYDHEISFYHLDGYIFLGVQRKTRSGGVGVYLRSGIAGGVAGVAVELAGTEAVTFTVGGGVVGMFQTGLTMTVVYRQPSASVSDFLHDLDNYLQSISPSSNHIMVGDININTLEESHTSSEYLNILSNYAFVNVINIPTRINTCLDHININFHNHIIVSGTLYTPLSDHLPTFINIDSPSRFLNVFDSASFSFRDYKKFNENSFLRDLADLDWNHLLNNQSTLDEKYDTFLQSLLHVCNTHAPNKSFNSQSQAKHQKRKAWITTEVLDLIKRKNYLYRRTLNSPLNMKLINKYKKIRNNLTTALRLSKSKYFEEKLKAASNAKHLWNIVNQELGKSTVTSPVPKLIIDDRNQVLEDEKGIADHFNSYFVNVGPNLAKAFGNTFQEEKILLHSNLSIPEFQFKKVDSTKVKAYLQDLNIKKATGLDNIPAKLLKLACSSICNPLTKLINESLESGQIPKALKIAKVKPLFKKGSVKLCSNYRPISILPVISKILEKIVNTQIMQYLESNNLIHENQFGFRKNKNTTLALTQFTNQILKAFNDGKSVLGVYLDFSKAFDTLDHQTLLYKLKQLKFSSNSIKWVENFLSQRKQVTIIGQSVSDELSITCGVPQGSILGPTLFLIYINDLPNILTVFTPILYADDTNLFLESKDLDEQISAVNNELNEIQKWCTMNKLTLNVDKTNFMILKNNQNKYEFPRTALTLHGKILNQVESVKFLGVHIDTNLSWKVHIKNFLIVLDPC